MKRILATSLVALGFMGSAHADWVFVGSWNLGDGTPWYTDLAPTLSGQGAAASLFGGSPGDYAISTAGSDPGGITHTTWIDQIFVGLAEVAETHVVDDGDGIYMVAGDTSAYVQDNDPGCFNRYQDPSQTCAGPDQKVNYAFVQRNGNVVPEPASIALAGLALAGLTAAGRRRRV